MLDACCPRGALPLNPTRLSLGAPCFVLIHRFLKHDLPWSSNVPINATGQVVVPCDPLRVPESMALCAHEGNVHVPTARSSLRMTLSRQGSKSSIGGRPSLNVAQGPKRSTTSFRLHPRHSLHLNSAPNSQLTSQQPVPPRPPAPSSQTHSRQTHSPPAPPPSLMQHQTTHSAGQTLIVRTLLRMLGQQAHRMLLLLLVRCRMRRMVSLGCRMRIGRSLVDGSSMSCLCNVSPAQRCGGKEGLPPNAMLWLGCWFWPLTNLRYVLRNKKSRGKKGLAHSTTP